MDYTALTLWELIRINYGTQWEILRRALPLICAIIFTLSVLAVACNNYIVYKQRKNKE